eukprot:Em0001g601a
MEKAKSKSERNLAKKTKFKETKAKDDFAAKLSVPQGTRRPFAAKGARVLQTVHRSLWKPTFKYEDLHVVMMLDGIFASGAWSLLSNLEDPELRRLAQALPAAEQEGHQDIPQLVPYNNGRHGRRQDNEVPSVPVQELHYLQHLSESTGSKAAVEEAVHGVDWHQPLGVLRLGKSTLSAF